VGAAARVAVVYAILCVVVNGGTLELKIDNG